jgi:hypothetical protein
MLISCMHSLVPIAHVAFLSLVLLFYLSSQNESFITFGPLVYLSVVSIFKNEFPLFIAAILNLVFHVKNSEDWKL